MKAWPVFRWRVAGTPTRGPEWVAKPLERRGRLNKWRANMVEERGSKIKQGKNLVAEVAGEKVSEVSEYEKPYVLVSSVLGEHVLRAGVRKNFKYSDHNGHASLRRTETNPNPNSSLFAIITIFTYLRKRLLEEFINNIQKMGIVKRRICSF